MKPLRRSGFLQRIATRPLLAAALLASAALGVSACGGGDSSDGGTDDTTATSLGKYGACDQMTVAEWTPSIDGADSSNHDDSSVEVTETTASQSVHPIPLNGAYSTTEESDGFPSVATFTFTVDQDLGASGSVTLIAGRGDQSLAIAADLDDGSVSVTPVLVSLTDPAGNEYVGLSSGCSTDGLYTCAGASSCDFGTTCELQSTGGFLGTDAYERRTQWEQHNDISSDADASVVTFPTCLWSGGYGLTCPFNPSSNNFLNDGRMRQGTYTAKYVLLTTYIATSSGAPTTGGAPLEETGKISFRALVKKDADAGSVGRGAIDLNIILAGDANVAASRTARGAMNLDLLLELVGEIFQAEHPGIHLGSVRALDWTCTDQDLESVDLSDTPELFRAGSVYAEEALGESGSAVNVFFVSSIPAHLSGTILGRAGAIPGATVSGTRSSGVVFASFDQLEDFNTYCSPGSSCTKSMMDASFVDMATTVAHETGHFLGLNHPSESDGSVHDGIDDTPVCTATGGSGMITISSCRVADTHLLPPVEGVGKTCSEACSGAALQGSSCSGGYDSAQCFCPEVQECQFNHVMWWSSKNIGSGGYGDGNVFSVESSDLLNLSPLVR